MELFHVSVTPQAIEYVTQTLRSTWLSEGQRVREFEMALVGLGLCNPVATNSCTAAMHLALAVGGIGAGDEVILPPQTFIATGLVILMQGATPVFADIQYETGNICPQSIRAKITERTKAIMPVHWCGYPCDMDEINAIADEYNLVVIEDAAQALGATYKGNPIGATSRFMAFSFQAIKHVTTGDGGVLCCLYDDDYREAKPRSWFGIDRKGEQSVLGIRKYDISSVGYKYHMNNVIASIGLGNLEALPQILERVREIAKTYYIELRDVPGLQLLAYKNDRESTYWLFSVLVERRLDFIKKLKSCGVPASVVHLRIDHNSVFGGITPDLPNQERYNEQQVSIPIHAGLTDDDVRQVIDAIKGGW